MPCAKGEFIKLFLTSQIFSVAPFYNQSLRVSPVVFYSSIMTDDILCAVYDLAVPLQQVFITIAWCGFGAVQR